MWPKRYRDYKKDESLVKVKLESGKDIVGCQMHELNGWGESYHFNPSPKKGFIHRFFENLFGEKKA